jgi:hypothetical protein
MTVAPANTSSIIVAITGVLQDPSTYSVSGTTLTFSAAPPSGTSNISVRYLGIPASGVTTTAYRTVTNTTATAGQTSFTIPSYTVGYVDVYRNGVYLPTSDYTATTGTTVVLNNAATVGDTITTISFYVSSVLNAIPATAGSVSTSYLVDGSVTSAKLANLTTLPTSGGNITLPAVAGTAMVSGNMPAFSAYLSSTQAVSAGTNTKIQCNTKEYDTANCYSTSTYTFTPNVAGYYQVNTALSTDTSSTATVIKIYKNNSISKALVVQANNGITCTWSLAAMVYMNGTTDYLEFYGQCNGSTNFFGGTGATFVQACLVRSA